MQAVPSVGIDLLLENHKLLKTLSGQRVGIITNKKMLTNVCIPSAYALHHKLGKGLQCIFTPEHGWEGMIAEGVDVGDGFDPTIEVPTFSLYGKSKAFEDFLAKNPLDVLLIDLQDLGLRCYTYAATCAKFLENFSGEVIVCDRPNPLGPGQQGPHFDPAYRSILSYIDVPFQHGLTLGELLSLFNNTLKNKASLRVFPCRPFHTPYAYPWIPPSPNLPSWESVLLYPALVLLEGTNLSEGRGTALPFTSFGAPGLDSHKLSHFINSLAYPGLQACPLIFTPQASKCRGQECQGIELILSPNAEFNALVLGKEILKFLKDTYEDFTWLTCPTSLGKECYFIDALMGTSEFRKALEH